MDRPEILKRCLDSIFAGAVTPTAVLVSDDSVDARGTQDVCSLFPLVSFIKGPGSGLCANRNNVIRHAVTEYISLLDDDAMLGIDFVARAHEIIENLGRDVIVTGDLIDAGNLTSHKNPSFLGYFTRHPRSHYETIHLNCNLFPRRAFDEVKFDERISYGYEDMDVCSHLLSLGYKIRYEPTLVNHHLAPALSHHASKSRQLQCERARFYTSLKRYFRWERSWVKGISYLLLAPLHRAAHALKRRNLRDIPYCMIDTITAVRDLISTGRMAD
jgi:GT2 family glycosyltransferase